MIYIPHSKACSSFEGVVGGGANAIPPSVWDRATRRYDEDMMGKELGVEELEMWSVEFTEEVRDEIEDTDEE